jgi:hypothetical protein
LVELSWVLSWEPISNFPKVSTALHGIELAEISSIPECGGLGFRKEKGGGVEVY